MASSTSTGGDHWKEIVRLNYKRLVQNTDIYMAADECFSVGIFQEEERDEVQSERIKHEKNRHFLNLLLHKSRSLFDKFMKSDFLNSEQNLHIKELLDVANVQTTKPRTESDVETNLQRRKIFRSYEKIVRTTTLRFMIDDFIAERVFDLEDYENIRTSDKNTHKENRRFLNILLTKHAGYQLLLNMLRETDHHELASQIEQENVDEDDDEEIKEFLSKQKQADQYKGHAFLPFKDDSIDRLKFIQQTNNLKSKTIPKIREVITKAEETQKEHSEKGTGVVNDINGWADEVISEINKKRIEMIQEVESTQSAEGQKLDVFKKKMEKKISKAEELVDSCQNEIKSTTDTYIVKLGLDLQNQVSETEKEIRLFPTLKETIFIPGKITNSSIRDIFGRCVDKEQETEQSADVLLPQKISHVIETKLEVYSEFQHETDKGAINAITTHENQTAWIATFQGNEIKHVDQAGHVDKTLTFTTKISGIVVTNDGKLLVTPNGGADGYQIKKINHNGDIVTFVDMKPLQPKGICTSKTGHIYVGCIDAVNYDVTDKNTRSVMKLSSTGIVQQNHQYDDKGQRLFTMPLKLQENVHDDVWVCDRTADDKGRVVVIQQGGQLRFIYTGVKNDKITTNFYPADITAAGNGNMLICDTNNDTVHVVDENGTLLYFLGSQYKTGIYEPTSISLDITHNQLWIGNLKGQVQVLRLK